MLFNQMIAWFDLGANSIDRAEIVTMTLEALSLPIPRVELSEYNPTEKGFGFKPQWLVEEVPHT